MHHYAETIDLARTDRLQNQRGGMREFYVGSHGLKFTYVAICFTIPIMNAT